jgi:folylpolyglutamate synthase/dihydropteroate synthase
LSFIKSYGNGRAIAALSEARKEHGDTMTQGLDEAEWEARFENINHSLDRLLHTLAEVFR